MSEILPQHVEILCLHVQQIVSGPLALVDLIQRVHERLRRGLHRCKTKCTRLIRLILSRLLAVGVLIVTGTILSLNGKKMRHRVAGNGGRRTYLRSKTLRNAIVGRDDARYFASGEKLFSRRFSITATRAAGIDARHGWLLSWPTSKPLLAHSLPAISRSLTNSSPRLAQKLQSGFIARVEFRRSDASESREERRDETQSSIYKSR